MEKRIHNLLIPNLDDKTFAELVSEARARIPLYAPEWTDHNLSDPGVTFLELFAWLVEMQIYSLNLIPERTYLKFLKLLGVEPKPAIPAKVDVTLAAPKKVLVRKGTQVTAVDNGTGKEIVFETDVDLTVLPSTIDGICSFGAPESEVYSQATLIDHTNANARNGVFYHAFGERAKRGIDLYLRFAGLPHEQETMLMVYVYESDLPPRGKHGAEPPEVSLSKQLAWEYLDLYTRKWETLKVRDETMLLTQNGSLSFTTPLSMVGSGNLSLIRCRIEKEGYEIPPRIDAIKLNTVSATHGRTMQDEVLGQSSGLHNQSFVSQHRRIIVGSQTVMVSENDQEPRNDTSTHVEDPSQLVASLIWEARSDLDSSGPEDKHYVLDANEGKISFGDGVNGRIPPKGSDITITYRYGVSEEGNIAANATWKPLRIQDGAGTVLISAQNDRPAYGWAQQESLEAVLVRLGTDLRVPYSAVTMDDYETIARSTPGLRVARAHAVPNPKDNLVTVTVVPFSTLERPYPSQGFIDTVCKHLNKHRLITSKLKVVPPQYVQVSVNATVRIKQRSDREALKDRIVSALNTFLHALNGGPDGNGWPFGRNVYRSEIYAAIEAIGGVDYVTQLELEGKESLFSVEVEAQSDLNDGKIPENLRQEFEDCEIPLSQDAFVSIEEEDSRWLITDNEKKYHIRKEDDELNIYKDYRNQNGNIGTPPLSLVYPGTHNISIEGL